MSSHGGGVGGRWCGPCVGVSGRALDMGPLAPLGGTGVCDRGAGARECRTPDGGQPVRVASRAQGLVNGARRTFRSARTGRCSMQESRPPTPRAAPTRVIAMSGSVGCRTDSRDRGRRPPCASKLPVPVGLQARRTVVERGRPLPGGSQTADRCWQASGKPPPLSLAEGIPTAGSGATATDPTDAVVPG